MTCSRHFPRFWRESRRSWFFLINDAGHPLELFNRDVVVWGSRKYSQVRVDASPTRGQRDPPFLSFLFKASRFPFFFRFEKKLRRWKTFPFFFFLLPRIISTMGMGFIYPPFEKLKVYDTIFSPSVFFFFFDPSFILNWNRTKSRYREYYRFSGSVYYRSQIFIREILEACGVCTEMKQAADQCVWEWGENIRGSTLFRPCFFLKKFSLRHAREIESRDDAK